MAPVAIGLFFFASIQLACMGILGEYVGAIHTLVMKRPLVVERERINFDPSSTSNVLAGPTAIASQGRKPQ